ncbi:MAG: nitrogen fixation protein NifQ [Methylococcaceae bacterium]|nr:nitrogen fixation protein NifQ [Methylococcaceae bacterium]
MNAVLKSFQPTREQVYQRLRALVPADSPNGEWLARLLASWSLGLGALPDHLGLEPAAFESLLAHCFAGIGLDGRAPSGRTADFNRMLEKQELTDYLLHHAARPDHPETPWIAGILVAGCLGEDHLWQDLGLWARSDLSALIACNFPSLAARNDRDMKWKKFLYKQLCEAEGIYVCRAPSCDVCIDYPKCFGPED